MLGRGLYSDGFLCGRFKKLITWFSTKSHAWRDLQNQAHFLSFVTYMGVILGGCISFFLHHRVAVNILDQSPLAKCCNGSHWVKDSAGWLLGFYGAAWSQRAELPLPGEYGWYHSCTHRHTEPRKQKGSDTPACVEGVWSHPHVRTHRNFHATEVRGQTNINTSAQKCKILGIQINRH